MYRCAPLVSLLLACTPGGGASVVKQQPPASPVAPAPVAPPPAPLPAGWAVRLGGGDFDAVSPVAVTRAGETLVLTWGSDDLAVENPEAGAQPAGRGVHLVRIGPQGELRGVSRVGDGFHVESAVATEDGGLTIAGIHYERASFTGIGERDVAAEAREHDVPLQVAGAIEGDDLQPAGPVVEHAVAAERAGDHDVAAGQGDDMLEVLILRAGEGPQVTDHGDAEGGEQRGEQ